MKRKESTGALSEPLLLNEGMWQLKDDGSLYCYEELNLRVEGNVRHFDISYERDTYADKTFGTWMVHMKVEAMVEATKGVEDWNSDARRFHGNVIKDGITRMASKEEEDFFERIVLVKMQEAIDNM